jgi:hypothetical protein
LEREAVLNISKEGNSSILFRRGHVVSFISHDWQNRLHELAEQDWVLNLCVGTDT